MVEKKEKSSDLANQKMTPLMRQYLEIKRQCPDSLLLFRLGDFYEMFFDDAKIASGVLGLALTSRNKNSENPVPLAGLPHHAAQSYINRLLRAGHKVAICEQVSDPKLSKGLVEREITRFITPGTVIEDDLLDGKSNNYLAAILPENGEVGLAFVDLSTGEFVVEPLASREQLVEQIARLNPAECLVPESIERDRDIVEFKNYFTGMITGLPDWMFDPHDGIISLKEHFGTTTLDGFGIDGVSPAIGSAGAIIKYLLQTQKTSLSHIVSLQVRQAHEGMYVGAGTIRNLEILETSRDRSRKGTLLWVLDKTQTAGGGRMLRKWLATPLVDIKAITDRQSAVQELIDDYILNQELREFLKPVQDLERLIARISQSRGTPRDVVALKNTLALMPHIKQTLVSPGSAYLKAIGTELMELDGLVSLIERAVVEEPPAQIADGGIIAAGYDKEIDELRSIRDGGKDWMMRFQEQEVQRTGISSLKVGYTSVFGYYIEITRSNLDSVPPEYNRKQTLVNAERFITPELKEYETKVLTAEEKLKLLEQKLFIKIREEVAGHTSDIQKDAWLIAQLDVICALAEVAVQNNYTMPKMVAGKVVNIVGGRHPVVEKILPTGEFVPNDVRMNEDEQILIITGPNMAGKSTYIRQIALIIIMAQVGSAVPAEYAEIGIVDKMFTRVGAADEIARGQSTFMVEMVETAQILNNATDRSFIVLDEVGRGTSTFDGVSLAWSITEYLHDTPRVSARTVFATHYHELADIAKTHTRIRNYNVAVRENKNGVVFLRKIEPGETDKSYGLHVAKLAGIPAAVLSRAEEILENLEALNLKFQGQMEQPSRRVGPRRSAFKPDLGQLTLFAPSSKNDGAE